MFYAGEDSVCKKVVIPIEVTEKTRISVVITSVGAYDSGNASLSAIQVVGDVPATKQDVL